MKKSLVWLFLTGCTPALAITTHCQQLNGQLVNVTASYHGQPIGFRKVICQLKINNDIAQIGINSIESKKPNIAATLAKTLKPIDSQSSLLKGNYSNPSHNLCRNLGGSFIGFSADGVFTNLQGESDMCVFGDGSMISGWTLIHIANERPGYEVLKNTIPSQDVPLFK